jgi:hypothetical protein
MAFKVPGRADSALGGAAAMTIDKIGITGISFNLSLRHIRRLRLQFKSLPFNSTIQSRQGFDRKKKAAQRENPA